MTFEAKYSGRCGVCDGAIRVGDECLYVEDEVAHAHCPQASVSATPAKACPRCWMIPSSSGVCECF